MHTPDQASQHTHPRAPSKARHPRDASVRCSSRPSKKPRAAPCAPGACRAASSGWTPWHPPWGALRDVRARCFGSEGRCCRGGRECVGEADPDVITAFDVWVPPLPLVSPLQPWSALPADTSVSLPTCLLLLQPHKGRSWASDEGWPWACPVWCGCWSSCRCRGACSTWGRGRGCWGSGLWTSAAAGATPLRWGLSSLPSFFFLLSP